METIYRLLNIIMGKQMEYQADSNIFMKFR